MKNDLFLKISALLLVLLLCTPLLMACNDSTWQPPSDPSGESSGLTGEEESPSLPRFDGETVKFYVNGKGLQSRSIDIGEDDDPTHMVNVAVKKRNEQVEKELGVDIVLATVGSMQESLTHLQPILASEAYVYDVVMLNRYFDMGLAVGDTVGSFYNLCDLSKDFTSYLNLEASYWDRSSFKELTYKGINYFITGDLSLYHSGGMYVSFFNADMWAKYADRIKTLEHSGGYSDIYDIVKNGYWTLDLWMELTKLCYKDDGDKLQDSKDRCGLMIYEQNLNCTTVDALMAGSGVRFADKDSYGHPTVEIYTDENVAFYNKLYTLFCQSDTVIIPWVNDPGDGSVKLIMEIFAKGNVLLNVGVLAQAEKYLSDTKDDFLILPLPLFDHSRFDKASPSLGYTTRHSDDVSQIAICTAIGNDKLPAVTATLDLMAYYSEKWVTPAHRQVVQSENREATDEMLDLIEAGIYTDFVFAWSHSLSDTNWQLRQHYTEHSKIDKNLKAWDRNATTLLNNKVLLQIEEMFVLPK
ncbi:MAG: hypothetical protein IJY89_04655 [Clostridia bacterium]|nr:hypothetical protein [Clostridia bacterium]